MIRKDKRTFKDGSTKTFVRVVEGYRPYPSSPPKQRTVQSFGYIEDQEDLDAFWAKVNECNKSIKKILPPQIDHTLSEMMYDENNRVLNYGYKFLESVFHTLKIRNTAI